MRNITLRPIILAQTVVTMLMTPSCAPNRAKQAESIYDEAINAFSAKKTERAKMLIDSLRTYYADIPTTYHLARDLSRLICRYEAERTVAFLDSSLAVIEAKQREMLKEMAVDDPAASTPVYIAKGQLAWKSYNRCYLKARADANGLFSITSNFVGENAIHHDHIIVSCGDEYVKTTVVTDGVCKNSFTDDEYTWETLRYEGSDAADLARFIASNADNRIVVQYLGPRAHYVSVMTDVDKQAVSQVWELSCVLRESLRIRTMIRSARIEMTRSATH